ncbi:MAG: hypothetical protein JWM80_2597 [Cyanobacteria bacterium RYN_339]|nr:hypothetical protein [Cyanobacteria bacterium RYN_339]
MASPEPIKPGADALNLDGQDQAHVDFPELGAYAPPDGEAAKAGIAYTTQHGHSLHRLAHQLGTDADTLIALNGWDHGQHIPAGTVLKLPHTDATAAKVEQYRAEYGADKVNLHYMDGPAPAPVPPPAPAPGPGPHDHPAPPPAPPAADGKLGDPKDYFFTQYRSHWNPNGPSKSKDCGPTSLAMALKAFGKAGPDVEQTISDVRFAMTGARDSHDPTGIGEWSKAAEHYGLHPERVHGTDGIDEALARGRLVEVEVNPIVYNRGLHTTNANYACDGQYDGQHAILITGVEGNDYIINDPLSRVGPMRVPRAMLAEALREGGNRGISLAP